MPPLHVNRGVRSLVQIGFCIVAEIISPLMFCTAPHMVDETTIAVTTTRQRVTHAGSCSLQETFMPRNFASNKFLDRDAHNLFRLTATAIIFTQITLQANGATLQWTGTGNSRLFAVGAV
jgi:hypothetical protein